MDLYVQKSRSIPQKAIIMILELFLLWLSYWILFQEGGEIVFGWMGKEYITATPQRRTIIFLFSLIVFIRVAFTMIFLLKRKIPWEESISIPLAFALYYIGFALLVLPKDQPVDLLDYFGIAIFITGSFINTFSEMQRHFWKNRPENKGKLYTVGLFKYAIHINYFGDMLWVAAYAILTRNWYSVLIPLFLFVFFVIYNIPKLDNYLAARYKISFEEYRKKTKKFIPFLY